MTNQVDTSSESIEQDWARIVAEHSVDMTAAADSVELLPPVDQPEPSESVSGDAETTGLDFSGQEGVEVVEGGELQPDNSPTLEEKIAMAEMVINGALVFVFDALGGLDIPEDKYARMSRSWAVVIAKRFEGGIFEFMAKYKDELSAAGATMIFIGAVREGVAKKRETSEVKRDEKAAERQEAKADGVQQ
jgi:uncharacterized glyoxalase superfamily protein PhnB